MSLHESNQSNSIAELSPLSPGDQARTYLESIANKRKAIIALKQRADTLRDMADGMRGIADNSTYVSHPIYADAIPDAIAALDALVNNASERVIAYAQEVEQCSIALQSLGGKAAALLDLHYLSGKTLVEIGEQVEWRHDRRYMSVLHLQALEAFYEHMPHEHRLQVPNALPERPYNDSDRALSFWNKD